MSKEKDVVRHDSEKFLKKEEAERCYSVKDIAQQTGWVLGQFTEGGKESIASDATNLNGNQNYFVIGAPGRGKTSCIGYTNVMQAIVRGESVCVVDPKGEYCELLYNLFKEHGYATKVYNVANPAQSNAWNFCNEIFDVGTGKLDVSRLNTLVDVIMTSTAKSEKKDTFWGPGERNLLTAAIGLLAYKHEKVNEPVTIKSVLNLLVQNDISALMNEFEQADLPESHPAAVALKAFKTYDEKLRPNFLIGLVQRLTLFVIDDIAEMSSHDDISFGKMAKEKTAIFCIPSHKTDSMRILSNLFFSFLFRDISDTVDAAGSRNTLIPVNVFFDEFGNIEPLPNFERFISTVRSRKIYICIIVQSISQLEQVYNENNRETLIECCDTVVSFGCNGQKSSEFVSELCRETVIVSSEPVHMTLKEKSKLRSKYKPMCFYYAPSQTRCLITPDEASRLPRGKVFIYHAGERLIKANSLSYTEHPFYKQGLPAPMPVANLPKTKDMYSD